MKILTQPEAFKELKGPLFLGAGFFDGVHRGHQMVLEGTVSRARETGGQAWVLTFDRHPLSILAPSKAPKLLTTLDDRVRLFEKLGMDGVLVLPFTRQLALEEPETFVQSLCRDHLSPDSPHGAFPAGSGVSGIRCGDNWRFGRRAAGTPRLLAELGKRYGFRVEIVPYAFYQGKEISSTRIRNAVQEGRLSDAEAMLGRPFFIRDKVVHGRGVGDGVLNRATANIAPRPEGLLPPCGVYAVQVETGSRIYPGVADLGHHPTFGGDDSGTPVLETHVLDFRGNLYGKDIQVSFLSRLRDEKTFSSPDLLAGQINKDIEITRRIVAESQTGPVR